MHRALIAVIPALAVLGASGSARAQATPTTAAEPRFCPNRPSLESSACTTDSGRVHLEVSAFDWELDRDGASRTDTFLPGDLLIRTGLDRSTELQIGWSPYGRIRERDGGEVRTHSRTGDVRLAVRHAFAGADGEGLSYGIEPFVTLPVGRTPVGAGTWGAGVVLPLTYDVGDTVTLGFTGELDAQPDEDGRGRHFAANGAFGATVDLTDTLTATVEGEVLRDTDPAGATTQVFAATGLLWKVAPRRAFYAEAIGGLNHDTPDVHVYFGAAVLF